MGFPTDQKDPSGLPIYAPVPADETLVVDRSEIRRRRRGVFLKHAAFLSIAGFFWLCVFHQKSEFQDTVAAVSSRFMRSRL